MKKYLFTAVVLAASTAGFAQESLLFGMRGNARTLNMNPGAETRLALYLTLPGVTANAQLTRPVSQYFGDVNANFSGFTTPSEQVTTQVDADLLHAGMKLGKNILIFGSLRNQLDARIALDNDLARFALNGMRDAQGNVDPNYQGDFSDLAMHLSDRLTASAGVQIKLSKKLRVGAAYNQTLILADGGMRFSTLHFNSTDLGNGLNELSLGATGSLSYYGLLDQSMGQTVDEIMAYFDGAKVSDITPLLEATPRYSSVDLGATYRPVKKLRLTGSVLGLGAGTSVSRGFQMAINNSLRTSGFHWNMADTAYDPISDLTQQFVDSLSSDFSVVAPDALVFKPFQAIHAAAYCDLGKWHSVGVRYSQVARPSLSYTALAAEYHANLMKGWQISGGYTRFINSSQPMSDQFSVALQMRILPPLQIYVASSALGMFPSYDFNTSKPLIPVSLDRVNISAGVSFTFFEVKPKSERKAKNAKSSKTTPAAPAAPAAKGKKKA